MIEIIRSQPFMFFGAPAILHQTDDHRLFVALVDLCSALGLDPNGQRQRVLRDEVISDQILTLEVPTPYRNSTRKRSVICLNVKSLPYWLINLNVKSVKEDQRGALIRFMRDMADASWFVFEAKIDPNGLTKATSVSQLLDMLNHMPPAKPYDEIRFGPAVDEKM